MALALALNLAHTMAAAAILLPHTMATTRVAARVGASGSGAQTFVMCATLITADGPTTRAYAMARSGVAARGVEDGRSVSIDRDDKKLNVYLEYTKMRALAFITDATLPRQVPRRQNARRLYLLIPFALKPPSSLLTYCSTAWSSSVSGVAYGSGGGPASMSSTGSKRKACSVAATTSMRYMRK